MKKLLKGFTLIELLVVISIIGILASMVVASYITAQKQARDSARKAAIKNGESAYEQYYAENGRYPVSGAEISSAFSPSVQPTDPKPAPHPAIVWNSTSSTYCICATLEVTTAGNASNTACTFVSGGAFYCAVNKQ